MELDHLDRIAAEAFEGYIVRKDLVRKFARQYPVPTYVCEFLLGRYCASVDEEEIQEGLGSSSGSFGTGPCAAAKRNCSRPVPGKPASVKIIDIITARLDAKTDSYLATLPSLQLNDVRITDELVHDNERMLTGGFYAEIDLTYDAAIAQEKSGGRSASRPCGRSSCPSATCWTRSMPGEDALARPSGSGSCCAASAWSRTAMTERNMDVLLLRMVPFVERNYNMVELGPRGTGKSHLFQQISPYCPPGSGGKATVARMFVNNANGQRGLVCQYDVVCFDEISGVSFDQKDGVNIMKGYMESGEFSRGKESIRADRRHRHGGQLRGGRAAPAADRPSVRPAAAGDARRHGVHGPHPLLPARLGRAEDRRAAHDRPFRPGQRLPLRVLEPAAEPQPCIGPSGAGALRRGAERP